MSLVVEYVVQGDLGGSGPASATDSQIGVELYLAPFGKEIDLLDVEHVRRNLAEFNVGKFDVSLQSDFFFVGDITVDKALGEGGVVDGV